MQFAVGKYLPKATEINYFSASVKPTKPLLGTVQVDGKMEENEGKFPVKEEESIIAWWHGKNKHVESEDLKQHNVLYHVSEANCDITERYKLMMQRQDTRNSVTRIASYLWFIKHTTMLFLQNGRRDSKSPILLLHSYSRYLESSSDLLHWLFSFFTVNTTDCHFWLSWYW